jgi:undecaprenyl-diphosphatase
MVRSSASASRAPHVHAQPPLTPASFLLAKPRFLRGLAVLFVLLAMAAAVDRGSLLLTWDDPIQRWVESLRAGWLDRFFLSASRLGSTVVVLVAGTAAAAITWRRCHAVATAVFVATFSRPLLEFVLKLAVGRDRPDFDRLVAGNGHSFPSGHVMASVALWGLLPMVVALYTRRRSVWWASVVVSAVMVVSISTSRMYLGVHWFSDVVGGLVLGAFFLLGVEAVLTRQHRRRACGLLAHPALAGGDVPVDIVDRVPHVATRAPRPLVAAARR